MIVIRLSAKSASKNLECEKKIINNPLFQSEVVLLFYVNNPAVILGKHQKHEDEVYSHKPHPGIFHRLSGGGAVVHDTGVLNYSLILPIEKHLHLFDIENSYKVILGAVIEQFKKQEFYKKKIFLYRMGISDLCIRSHGSYRKISGNSQARKNGRLLHHGTFIFRLPPVHFFYYLKQPKVRPDYRKNMGHRDFLIQHTPLKNPEVIRKIITHGLHSVVNEAPIRDLSGIFHDCEFNSTVHGSAFLG